MNLDNPRKPESKLISVSKVFIAPLLAAFMGFLGSYIGIQKDVSSITAAIVSMSADIKELKQKQDSLYKDYYLPNRGEWTEMQDKLARVRAEHDEVKSQLRIVTEDVKNYHRFENRK